MKILNLYAGIGGNRKLWNEVSEDIDITSVEFDETIAEAYQDRYPNDTVIVCDAKEYLLQHYNDFDFIWVSPPCQTHSAIRKCKVDCRDNPKGSTKAVYPDITLYEIVIFLKHHIKYGKWIVENVKPYYKPLIKPDVEIDRHLYWSNFKINYIEIEKNVIIEKANLNSLKDFDLKKYRIKNKQQVIRNQVHYEIGKHILECALNVEKKVQNNLFGDLSYEK